MNAQLVAPPSQQAQQPAIKHFAMCPNNGLQVCASCSRNVENHRHVANGQPMLSPTLGSGGRCGDWRA
jgi:hypothetical protein